MSGRIPRSFIDEVVARSDLVEIIEGYLALRKAGKEYMARCPFHEEKSPSFHVSREKQVYHCFGCGASGNVLTFLMEHSGQSFTEAVEELASRLALTVPREEGAEPGPLEKTDDLYTILKEADGYYRQQLRRHPRAEQAVAYLKKRGLSGEIAAEFGLGYAPPGWDNLLKALGLARRETLLKAGMLIEREHGGYYDRFRERVMFPIQDQRGRVIAFGGRVLGDDKPKYLNSPETSVFHKGQELYGLYQARKQRPPPDSLIVVEGYMDVVALAQYGIRNAVATLGTATSAEHLNRLFRLVDKVVFCFDGDEAGLKAAWRALEVTLPLVREGRQAAFMFLPAGEDPDSLVRKQGADGFASRLAQAMPLSDFLFRHLSEQVDLQSLDGRARLVELARPLLAELLPGAYRELLVERLAELARMDIQALRHLLRSGTPPQAKPAAKSKGVIAPSPMRTAIALLLQYPWLARQQQAEVSALTQPGADLLRALLEFLRAYPNITSGTIIEHWRDSEHYNTLQKLAVWRHGLPESGIAAEFNGALQRLQEQAREQRLESLIAKSRFAPLTEQERQEFGRLAQEAGSIVTRH
jgi:DNA primase